MSTVGRDARGAWRLALLLACAVVSPSSDAGTPQADRQELKSAFIYNFLKFTQWPADALGSVGQPIVIGVLDDSDLARALRDQLARRSVADRPVAVRTIKTTSDIADCHVLFVGAGSAASVEAALARAKGSPMLTLGNGVAFLDAGGMLAFDEQGETLRFAANPDAAVRAGLTLNSQLLRVAMERPRFKD